MMSKRTAVAMLAAVVGAWLLAAQCRTCPAYAAPSVAQTPGGGSLVKVLFDFETGKPEPFEGGTIVPENVFDIGPRQETAPVEAQTAPRGKYALKVDKDWASCDKPQDWTGYDFLKLDVFNPQDTPIMMHIEVRDAQTKDYWTRVNFTTVVPPGKSTVSMPTNIYVGEKSRPGRGLIKSKVTRLVLSPEQGKGALIFDNIRLERLDAQSVLFEGLMALDFGLPGSPTMPGYIAMTSADAYSKARGSGWLPGGWTKGFDGLQPDALFQDFVIIPEAAFGVDLPNGKYHVILNIDCPGGFWGEVQQFTKRQVLVNGKAVVDETMDVEAFKQKYFRHAHQEDMPGLDTFAQYVEPMFQVKQFDIEVTDGKAVFGFKSDGRWGISLSSMVIYPQTKADAGRKFWDWTTRQRRNQFNDYFKQIVPKAVGAKAPTDGYVVFSRGASLVGALDGPRAQDAIPAKGLACTLARGDEQPISFAVGSGADLGQIDLVVSEFSGPGGVKLDARTFVPGWFDYRITRVTVEGSVYTVAPRYWHRTPAPAGDKRVTRNFWIRTKIAASASPGIYTGKITIKPANGTAKDIPVTITVLPFAIDPVTDVAAGPWGCGLYLPWDDGAPQTRQWDWQMFENVLQALHDNGFNTVTGLPHVGVKAANGKLELDFALADKEMKALRDKGFDQMISGYGAGLGYKMYGDANGPDEGFATKAGFAGAEAFLKALYGAIEEHAAANNWLPIAWNLCDEPLGEAAKASARNAALHDKVATDLKLKHQTFMGATSMEGADPKSDHYGLVTSLSMPSLNLHDAASIKLIRDRGHSFSFYNDGTRWTYGRYMKALVIKYGLAYRVTWHLNAIAGDPYYALDCREDDYCFYNTDEKQSLVPSATLLCEILPGLNDYRYLSTLQRLVKEKASSPAAAQARKVFDEQVNLVAGKDRSGPTTRAGFDADREAVINAIMSLVDSK